MATISLPGMGWRRDSPDFRDYASDCPAVQGLLAGLPAGPTPPPPKVDLREFFSPVEDQESRHRSPACACLDLVEYFQRRANGHAQRGSRRFLQGTTQRMMGVQGDSGADLRTTLKALIRFGVPPEPYWPAEPCNSEDRVGDPMLYGFALDYRAIHYVRLDSPNAPGARTLDLVKSFLAAGFPSIFGFPVPSSVGASAYVPYRPTLDSIVGGQAAVAVGYDDNKRAATKGALIIRSFWGSRWGDEGYGWLPYKYVENQLAVDFWTLLHKPWLDSGEFLCPTQVTSEQASSDTTPCT